MQADEMVFDDGGPGTSIIAAGLYGVASIWGAVNVIAAQNPMEETLSHLIVRLSPQFLVAAAALLQAVVAFRKSARCKHHDCPLK